MSIIRRLALAGVIVIVVGTVTMSNAATLSLSESHLSTVGAERCVERAALEPVASSPRETSVSVQFSGLSEACMGSAVDIALFGDSGTVVSRASVTLPDTTITPVVLHVPEFDPVDVQSAAMTVASWGVPTTWAFTGTGSTCEVFDTQTGQPMTGASCAFGDPTFTWGDAYWQNLAISYPLTSQLPELGRANTASYYAYYVFSFTLRPAAPEWWSWDTAGLSDTWAANWCEASLDRLPNGMRVTGRTGSNIGIPAWSISMDAVPGGVATSHRSCEPTNW